MHDLPPHITTRSFAIDARYRDRAVWAVSGFSRSGYAALLDQLRAHGYAGVDYAAVDPSAAHLILRHDIDVSPEPALPLAEVEAGQGFSAYYFFLTTGELYNPAAASVRRVIARLSELGHRIGLHFDASVYPADADLDCAAAQECQALENIAGRAVDMVSFHRPTPGWLGNAATIAGRAHTYQPRYFSEIGYCSDSRGGWHNGEPLQHKAVASRRALQLLTHPVWWSGPDTPQACLNDALRMRFAALDQHLAQNVTIHKSGRIAGLFKDD